MKLAVFVAALACVEAFAPAAPSKVLRSKVLRPQAAAPTMAIGGVNGALDFGNLASGVGGEGTGIALGANEPALLAIIIAVPTIIGVLFSGWQSYQDDDEDFFDTYESRRTDRVIGNRNRVTDQ